MFSGNLQSPDKEEKKLNRIFPEYTAGGRPSGFLSAKEKKGIRGEPEERDLPFEEIFGNKS
jgi:hypothetical protein